MIRRYLRRNPRGHHPSARGGSTGPRRPRDARRLRRYRRHNPQGRHPDNLCKTCRVSGEEHFFQSAIQCRRCYNLQRRHHPDNKCATPGCSAEGGNPAFVSPDQCMRCDERQRNYAVIGRRCTSCGWTDAEYARAERPYGSSALCQRCNLRKKAYKKRKWPVMCVSGQHLLPPPRTAFSASTPIHMQPRDFPACNCIVDTEGVEIPDPNIRHIPLEDEADPSRGYIPVRERFRDFEDRSDPGESRERSQIPGHSPSEEHGPEGRKGFSGKSPRRSIRGGSKFDTGPRRPRDARRLRRYRRHNPQGRHPDNLCKTCRVSGEEHFFVNSDQCRRCYRQKHKHHPDNKCATLGCPAKGKKPAFVSLTQCEPCYYRKRSYAVLGRSCTSCGWTDADYVKVGKPYGIGKILCNRCSVRKMAYKRKKWPVMCVSGQHALPPPRTAFSESTPLRKQPRDFPACNCIVDTEGVVIPDPNIRHIPLEDEADPSRGYIPLKARFRLAEDRSDPGESRERSQSPGHGPYKGDAPFDPTGIKGSSGESPRRSARGGSPFDIGPRRPRDARRLRRYRRHNPQGRHPDNLCKTCKVSGEEHYFGNLNQCMRCYNRQRRHHSDNKCATPSCSAKGALLAFSTPTQCERCYRQKLRYHPDNDCATCSAEGEKPAFSSPTQCKRCYRKQRSYAVLGRRCTSCGWTDADYAKVERPYGKYQNQCQRCKSWELMYKKRKWPVMCVSGQHVLPPPRTAFSASTSIYKQFRDFPACNCIVDTEGVVIPDPEVRRIPLEDEADWPRDYIPLRERFKLARDRFDLGESEEASRILGHGPYTGDAPFDPTGRKGSSGESPRRTTRGGSTGPRRPRDARRLRRYHRSNPGHLQSVERLAEGGHGEFSDYYPETAAGDYGVHNKADLYYVRNVIWDGVGGKMVRAYPDYIQHIFGNIFDKDKLAAIVSGIDEAEERVIFTTPYGTANKIGLSDVKESIEYSEDEEFDRPYSTGDEELDRYLVDPEDVLYEYADPDEEPDLYASKKEELDQELREAVETEAGDLGQWAITVRDGNHRAFGALLAGEPYVYVMLADNQYQDFKEGRSPELEEILE